MNDQTSLATRVEVGTPPSGFRRWEFAAVDFHGFENFPGWGGDPVESPEFECLGHRWTLDVSNVLPGGGEDADDGMVSVFLYNMSEEDIEIDFFFTVWDSTGKQVARYGRERGKFTTTGWYHGALNFAKRSTISKALVDGTLTIGVRMRKPSEPTGLPSVAFIPENPLYKNILKMFMDEESADVVFKVGDGDAHGERPGQDTDNCTFFHAHRLILRDGAPVLAELCKSGAVADAASVQIAGVNPDVFHRVLYYVYGGKLSGEELEENAREIIDAADKFGVSTLKLEAEASYVKSTEFTVRNILDNLLYAESKNCAHLKEAVMEFIVENGAEIVDNVSFDDVPGSVVKDLLTAMNRGKKGDDGSTDASNYNVMRVATLRKMLHDKGLDVDGSREAMIALLKENS